MKLGVVGVGNIAQKAYLPTYLTMGDNVDFYFATRNKTVQLELKERYRYEKIYSSIDELIDQNIEACMIHAATKSHYSLIKKCLHAGIHVFVDKPISENLEDVTELLALANQKNLLLMTGFNRRFAPKVQELKKIPNKQLILLQKNRIDEKLRAEYAIYDLFLHLVDTAVYLLDEPIIQYRPTLKEKNGYLKLATLQLETNTSIAYLSMDLQSGANVETFQVTSPAGSVIVRDLVTLEKQENSRNIIETASDWSSTLEKRGFQQMVYAFVESIEKGQVSSQDRVQLSHQLCSDMLRIKE